MRLKAVATAGALSNISSCYYDCNSRIRRSTTGGAISKNASGNGNFLIFAGMKMVSNTCRGFCRIVAMLLTFHFLNCSIDGRDRNPDFVPEDLRSNDIETFTEFITEIVFKWQNAFEEHEEKDNESGTSIDHCQYYFSNQALVLTNTLSLPVSVAFNHPATQHTSSLARDVIAPPPKL